MPPELETLSKIMTAFGAYLIAIGALAAGDRALSEITKPPNYVATKRLFPEWIVCAAGVVVLWIVVVSGCIFWKATIEKWAFELTVTLIGTITLYCLTSSIYSQRKDIREFEIAEGEGKNAELKEQRLIERQQSIRNEFRAIAVGSLLVMVGAIIDVF